MDPFAIHRIEPAGAPVLHLVNSEPLDRRQIIAAVRSVNRAELLGDNRELAFRMDRESQRPVVQVLDRETKEVILQVPPAYLLRALEDLNLDRNHDEPGTLECCRRRV